MTEPQKHEEGFALQPRRKYSAIRAVVTRADGTVEDRGIIAFSHRNPVINAVLSPLARFNGWIQERASQYHRRNNRP